MSAPQEARPVVSQAFPLLEPLEGQGTARGNNVGVVHANKTLKLAKRPLCQVKVLRVKVATKLIEKLTNLGLSVTRSHDSRKHVVGGKPVALVSSSPVW